MAIIESILLLLALGGIFVLRLPLLIGSLAISGILLLFTFHSSLASPVIILIWLIFILAVCVLNVTYLRRQYIIRPIFALFKKLLPSISETEQVALDAGDLWWEAELFRGSFDWSRLMAMPVAKLTAEEQSFVDNETEQLCTMINEWEMVTEHGELPQEVWQFIKAKGFLGMVISKAYGGKGFSAMAHSAVVTKLASRSYSAAVSIMVPNSLGPAELLSHYGTEEQKQHYLPRLATGNEIPCFALTGTESGSDAAAMADHAVICRGEFEGAEVVGMKVTWDKRYITLAPIATLLGLAIKLYDPEHLLGEQEDLGITLCLIPTNHPGVRIGRRHCPLQMPFLNGPTSGDDVFIPLDWIIGGPERIGQGWQMLMECLGIGRAISLPAVSCATGLFSYRMTGAYARLRQQFRIPIGKFEGVAESLAHIAGFTYLLEACRIVSAQAVDNGLKPSLVSAIAKYHMTEMSRKVMDHTMDIHAGRGIQLGPRNYIGMRYFAIPIGITVEGANILTRNLMIFGQGAVRCHPYIQKEIAAAHHSDQRQGLKEFDSLVISHAGYFMRNLFRTLFLSFVGGISAMLTRKRSVKRYSLQVQRMSSALALVADTAMVVLGGDLKRKETLSARLGDVLSYLYLAACVLKYHQTHHSIEDRRHVHWCLQYCLLNAQQAFYQFFDNFKPRGIAVFLKRWVFPFGAAYKQVSDHLHFRLAEAMQQPNVFRDELTKACFVSKDNDDPAGRVEQAFQRLTDILPIEKKIQEAIKDGILDAKLAFSARIKLALQQDIIDDNEVKLLEAYEMMRIDAIQVDDFAYEDLIPQKKTDELRRTA